jgi:hypothetical protein
MQKVLAMAVAEAIERPSPAIAPTLDLRFETVPLPFAPPPSRTELEARAASPDGFVARHARSILEK